MELLPSARGFTPHSRARPVDSVKCAFGSINPNSTHILFSLMVAGGFMQIRISIHQFPSYILHSHKLTITVLFCVGVCLNLVSYRIFSFHGSLPPTSFQFQFLIAIKVLFSVRCFYFTKHSIVAVQVVSVCKMEVV